MNIFEEQVGGTHVIHAGPEHDHPLILLHGGGPGAQAQSNWTPTLRALGGDAHVMAPDLVGFGRTVHPDPPPFGPEAWFDLRIAQLIELADHFGHERVNLVGNSLGGALALRFALAHPERLDHLILMGSAGPPMKPTEELLNMLAFGSDPTAEHLASVLRSFVYDLERFGDVDELVAARLPEATRPEVQRSWHAMFHDEAGHPAGAQLALTAERVRTIEHPTLIVHGRDDRIIPIAGSLWLLEQLPDADLHVFARCGHWAMLEQPQKFARLVRDFVTSGKEQVL
jgi:2-hydroxymuconate-semialdehyde hydrolase